MEKRKNGILRRKLRLFIKENDESEASGKGKAGMPIHRFQNFGFSFILYIYFRRRSVVMYNKPNQIKQHGNYFFL